MEERGLLQANMLESHKRILIAAVIICGLANLAIFMLYVTGKTSANLTINKILTELLLTVVIVLLMVLIWKRWGTEPISKYLMIFLMGMIMANCDYYMSGTREIFADLYMVIALSLLYFDVGLTVFAFIEVLIIQAFLLVVTPTSLSFLDLATRYLNFAFFGLAAAITAGIARRLLQTSIEKEEQAKSLTLSLKEVAGGVAQEAGRIAGAAKNMLSASTQTGEAAEQVNVSVENLATAASEEAVYANKTNELVNEMAQALGVAGKHIEQVGCQSGEFKQMVVSGLDMMEEQKKCMQENDAVQGLVREAVTQLDQQARQIEDIVGMITSIAGQTNLLALNAAIEAARAGDAGRGFAVVAEQVRKLAEESGQAASRIAALVQEVQHGVYRTVHQIDASQTVNERQVKAAGQTEEMFGSIERGAGQIDQAIQELSAIIQEVLASTDEVVQEVESISSTTEETAASTQEISALTEQQTTAVQRLIEMAGDLSSASQHLNTIVEGFR